MMITIFIVIQGALMLTVYGFSIWFALIIVGEVILLVAQIILLKFTNYPKWFDVAIPLDLCHHTFWLNIEVSWIEIQEVLTCVEFIKLRFNH